MRIIDVTSETMGETGFFVNRLDAEWMMSEKGQDAIARAYFAGMRPWLKVAA